jgi:hypothetical protein
VARAQASVEFDHSRPPWRLRDLWRLACWGFCAALALFIAVSAAITDIGHARIQTAMSDLRETLIPSGVKPVRPLDAREGRRLAETVRELSVERDALKTRIAAIEHGLGGVTGSIARVERAARQPAWLPLPVPAPSPALVEATSSAAEPEEASPTVHASSTISPPELASAPLPASNAKAEFGLDLGNGTSVESLRAAWTAASRRHSSLLGGLGAVVQTRQRGRGVAVELRLIAGPIPTAAAAARLCAAMIAAGAVCAPAPFEGQRLAVR